VVKSRQQTSLDPSQKFMQIAKDLYRAEGIRGFYRGIMTLIEGFGITICRSAPTSGMIFLVYEMLQRNFTVSRK
jgi:mitochondrial ornithine carrier protein